MTCDAITKTYGTSTKTYGTLKVPINRKNMTI